MPSVDASLVEGRTPEVLRMLILVLREATEGVLGAPEARIRVVRREASGEGGPVGGRQKSKKGTRWR